MSISAVRFSYFGKRSGRIGLGDLLDIRSQRRALKHLSPRQLADIGISPKEAEQEASRPLWHLPTHWHA